MSTLIEVNEYVSQRCIVERNSRINSTDLYIDYIKSLPKNPMIRSDFETGLKCRFSINKNEEWEGLRLKSKKQEICFHFTPAYAPLLLDKRISANAKILWLWINWRAYNNTINNFVNMTTYAEDLEVPVRSIFDWMKELKSIGAITTEYQKDKDGYPVKDSSLLKRTSKIENVYNLKFLYPLESKDGFLYTEAERSSDLTDIHYLSSNDTKINEYWASELKTIRLRKFIKNQKIISKKRELGSLPPENTPMHSSADGGTMHSSADPHRHSSADPHRHSSADKLDESELEEIELNQKKNETLRVSCFVEDPNNIGLTMSKNPDPEKDPEKNPDQTQSFAEEKTQTQSQTPQLPPPPTVDNRLELALEMTARVREETKLKEAKNLEKLQARRRAANEAKLYQGEDPPPKKARVRANDLQKSSWGITCHDIEALFKKCTIAMDPDNIFIPWSGKEWKIAKDLITVSEKAAPDNPNLLENTIKYVFDNWASVRKAYPKFNTSDVPTIMFISTMKTDLLQDQNKRDKQEEKNKKNTNPDARSWGSGKYF